MCVKIEISDKDIKYAERILLNENQHFNNERIAFIKNLETIDLQAIPGSGKTTVLLAKLLILEEYLPLVNNSGVLVISHTNAAVDEIKNKISQYCPKLFGYPNFVGTIQSFVNTFLAIPFYINHFKTKPYRIDSEIYDEKIKNVLSNIWSYKFDFSKDVLKKIFYIKNANPSIFYSYRFEIDNYKIILTKSLNSEKLKINKPRGRTRNYKDYIEQEKKVLYHWFFRLKKEMLFKHQILHFDDAYFLANYYLIKYPDIKNILQKRFKYVFVDEMQDMEIHQYKLLESIFYDEGNCTSVFQRIGDKNQAIFDGSAQLMIYGNIVIKSFI